MFWIYVWCDFRSHGIQSVYVEVNKLDGKDKGRGEELEKRVSALLGHLSGLIFWWLHLKVRFFIVISHLLMYVRSSNCLQLVATTDDFVFSACWGLDFFLIFLLFWFIWNLFPILTLNYRAKLLSKWAGDWRLEFCLLECLTLHHLTLLVPPSLNPWASSQEDLTQQLLLAPP